MIEKFLKDETVVRKYKNVAELVREAIRDIQIDKIFKLPSIYGKNAENPDLNDYALLLERFKKWEKEYSKRGYRTIEPIVFFDHVIGERSLDDYLNIKRDSDEEEKLYSENMSLKEFSKVLI